MVWADGGSSAGTGLAVRPAVLPGIYEPRSAAGTVLHHVVRTHLDRFLEETAAPTDGAGVPGFVAREFRAFLGCGDIRRGFARVRCDGCAFERLVPFSCCLERDTMKSSAP